MTPLLPNDIFLDRSCHDNGVVLLCSISEQNKTLQMLDAQRLYVNRDRRDKIC